VTLKVTRFCEVTTYSLANTYRHFGMSCCSHGRLDLQNVGSSEASIQLYHTTRRHVQIESNFLPVGRSRLPSASDKWKISISFSSYISWFVVISCCFCFVRTEDGGNTSFRKLCTHESGEAHCRDTEDSLRNVNVAKIPRIVFAYQTCSFINFRLLDVYLPYWRPHLMWSAMSIVQKQELFLSPSKQIPK
jgi:hypothetical protein